MAEIYGFDDTSAPSSDLMYCCEKHDNWFTVNEDTSCGCVKLDAIATGRLTPRLIWEREQLDKHIRSVEDYLAYLYEERSLYNSA